MSGGMDWLEVESLDLEAQGVARRAGGRRRRQGGLHRRRLAHERVQVSVSRKKNNWEQGQMSALQRESAQRVRPGCPHFGLHSGACGGCKMQHLHPAAQVAVKQRVLEDNLWHLAKVKPEPIAAPIDGPGLGLPRPGAPVGALGGQEGTVLIGFPRAQVALCGRHAGVPGAAAKVSAMLMPLRGADRQHGPARPPAADRTGHRQRRTAWSRRWCCATWSR
jgi:23S rRNA (uracil1939-C5)-methyltransferase